MTRELIDDMREVILPFVKKVLLKTNYEGLGKSDAKIFERDFNEILNLAIKALEQEPIKPMVEIDLYSVIKQKYIEREVLDKIRAEIERQEKWLMDAGYNAYNVDIAFSSIKLVIDRYKAESEKNKYADSN